MISSSNNHLTVLHVIDSAGYGGGERYILDLVKYASPEIRHRVAVPHQGVLGSQLESAGCPYHIINMRRRFSVKSVRKLVRLIQDAGIQIIHSHGYRSNLYGRAAALLSRRRHVCTVHVSLYDYLDTPLWLRWIYRMAERATSILSDQFICISSAMANDMIKLGINEKKIIRISNGVDLNRFYPRQRDDGKNSNLGIKNKSLVIGTVGRMVSEKGQIYLIHALARLKDAFPDLVCLFVGEGPLLSDLKAAAARLRVNDICRFIGVRDDMERIYPVLDLFVLPSIREPFGLVLLEAMASGIPVIAMASGGPLDFIDPGSNGMIALPGDPDALADQIAALLADSEKRKRIGRQGHITAMSYYDVRNTVRRIEAVYRSMPGLSK